MDILVSIGLDYTIAYQLVIFLVTFIAVNNLIFKPYMKALEARKERTQGNQAVAEEVLEETKNLELEYEKKARALNSEHKTIYDHSRTDAMHEYDEIVNKAKDRANEILATNRKKIQDELAKAEQDIQKEIPSVSASIATKLLGKEITS